jgi:predicted transcriptional regulator
MARCDSGKHFEADELITIQSIEALLSILTPKRIELLRHMHRIFAQSITSLAETLGRAVKSVDDDV